MKYVANMVIASEKHLKTTVLEKANLLRIQQIAIHLLCLKTIRFFVVRFLY